MRVVIVTRGIEINKARREDHKKERKVGISTGSSFGGKGSCMGVFGLVVRLTLCSMAL